MRERVNIPPKTRFDVMRRDGFRCIYCGATSDDDKLVIDHIVPFSKGGAEEIGNYATACRKCNQGKAAKEIVPVDEVPVEVEVVHLYLAGKITGTDWRDKIIPGWSEQNHTRYSEGVRGEHGDEWHVVKDIGYATPGVRIDYVGPWWCDEGVGGGHGLSRWCGGLHAYGGDTLDNHGFISTDPEASARVAKNVRKAIRECDLVFAWVDSDDCYGTLFEIGLAIAMGRRVVFASPENPEMDGRRDELWLSRHFCESIYAASPFAAWRKFWDEIYFNDNYRGGN